MAEPFDTSGRAAPAVDDPWYAPGLRFTCTQCGNCCTGPSGVVWFSDEEARAIASFLRVSDTEFRWSYAKWIDGRWTLDETRRPDGAYDCVFLRRDDAGKALCSIYPVRPTQCRTWPFWDGNLKSPRTWAAAAQKCPGTKAPDETGGRFFPVDQIRILARSNPRGL